jgi:hypothetical protein
MLKANMRKTLILLPVLLSVFVFSGNPEASGQGQPKTLNFGTMTAGDCVLENGRLTFFPDGNGRWEANIHTNHTTNRDIWHIWFSINGSGNQRLFTVMPGDSPGMYGSPSPTIPWVAGFKFNASQYGAIAKAEVHNRC